MNSRADFAPWRRYGFLVFVAVAFATVQAVGQTIEASSGELDLSEERIQNLLAEIEHDQTLDADARAKAVENCQIASRELTKQKKAAENGKQFQQDATTAAETAVQLKQELERTLRSSPLSGLRKLSIAELEAQRAIRETKIAVLKQDLIKIESLRKQRGDRRAEIRALQAEAESRRAELRQAVEASGPPGEPVVVGKARKLAAILRQSAFESSLTADVLELAKYEREESVTLLTHRENLVREQLKREEDAVQRLAAELSERRRNDAKRQVLEAEQQLLLTHPLLRSEAEKNRIYAEEAQRLATKIEGVRLGIAETRERLDRQQGKFADIREKEKQIGLTRPIGLKLREQIKELPDLQDLERQLDGRQELIDQARILSWDYSDAFGSLDDARTLVDGVVAGSEISLEQRREFERMATELLVSRRNLLTDLKTLSTQYFDALCDRDEIDRLYMQASGNYIHYINERILWIRSADPLSLGAIQQDSGTWEWLVAAANWKAVAYALGLDALEHPYAFWPTLLATVALFYVRLSIRPRLRALGAQAAKRGFLRYGPTAQSAVFTLMSSATVPVALLFVSWRLAEAVDPSNFVRSVASTLEACAAVLFPVELLRETCRHFGLAESHFNWPVGAVEHLRKMLSWMKAIGLPVTFFAVLSHYHDRLEGGGAAERVLFIGGMFVAGIPLHRMLHSDREIVTALRVEQPDSLFTRYHFVWYATAVAVPVILAGLSAVGYHYSAIQVAARLLGTVWLFLGAIIFRSLAVRWVVLSRRRLLLDQAYQRRAAAEEVQEVGGTPKPPTVEETDVAKSTLQTRKLVDVMVLAIAVGGLAIVWAATLPAIGLLDRPLPFWGGSESKPSVDIVAPLPILPTGQGATSTAVDSGASGKESSEEVSANVVTTLDLAVAMLVAFFTFLASRNLPGLMEMSVLNRLPVDNATRYAATRLASYAIVILGVFMTSNQLGLRWQNVQWLAAALTVGLGFGLQEVFANFVSGLIILFERPVRVGDIVTIADVTGVVSKIRMRATTITNWDRKEFIVPNKEFITGRLLNWTLSDAINRITINVGVAFGSDIEKAREILLRICDESPLILKDPLPIATFDAFGDSTFNLSLRCFLPNLEGRLEVVNYLHTEIAKQFAGAGVQIAFPQRDLNIKSVRGVSIPFEPRTAATSSGTTLERVAS